MEWYERYLGMQMAVGSQRRCPRRCGDHVPIFCDGHHERPDIDLWMHHAAADRATISDEPFLGFIGVPFSNKATNGIRATTLW